MTRPSLRLREAGRGDARLLFDWANDPTTRRMSFSVSAIEWDEHVSWLDATLRDPDCHLWIALDGATPVGQLRLDASGGREATLSFSVAPEWRGRGYGGVILRLAAEAARDTGRISALVAWVRPENEASLRAFARAGYVAQEPSCFRGEPARSLRLPLA